jgi:hypothetical protein
VIPLRARRALLIGLVLILVFVVGFYRGRLSGAHQVAPSCPTTTSTTEGAELIPPVVVTRG